MERVCAAPGCDRTFTPTHHAQRYCPPTPADRERQNGQARSSCARRAYNVAHRSTEEQAECVRCGTAFSRSRDAAKVYCSDACHHGAKRERYGKPAELTLPDPWDATRSDTAAYKRTLRLDPCAYCGERPCGGVDHIVPTLGTGDRSDTTNMIGCCKRCNETKRTLPLLLALPWIPLSREYHDRRRELFAA